MNTKEKIQFLHSFCGMSYRKMSDWFYCHPNSIAYYLKYGDIYDEYFEERMRQWLEELTFHFGFDIIEKEGENDD